jgi:hypothetical protein
MNVNYLGYRNRKVLNFKLAHSDRQRNGAVEMQARRKDLSEKMCTVFGKLLSF